MLIDKPHIKHYLEKKALLACIMKNVRGPSILIMHQNSDSCTDNSDLVS